MVSGRLFSCRAVPVGSQRQGVANIPCSRGSRSGIYKKKRGIAQAHFNVGGYSKTPIIVPCLDIQKKVVEMIESRLSVCDSIEKTIDTALQEAEALRQSILKQAFEGGL